MIITRFNQSGRGATVNRRSDQHKNLIGCWFMPSSFSRPDVLDLSINNHHATFQNEALWQYTHREFGPSVFFDGTDDFLNVPLPHAYLFNDTQSWSVAAWIYPQTTSGTHNIARCDTALGGTRDLWGVRISSNKLNVLFGDVAGTLHSTSSTASLQTDAWSHVVATVSPSTVRLYINGAVDDDSANAASTPWDVANDQAPLTIACVNPGPTAEEFHGNIAEVRIYLRELSSGEVAALYDPATRWDLYKMPQRIYGKAPAAAAQTEGPLVKGRLIRGGSLSGVLVR